MSIKEIMRESEGRFQKLHKLINEIKVTEEDIATKVAATLSIANLLVNDFFFAIDITGKIIFSNDAKELGYTKEELAGQHITMLIPEEDKAIKWNAFLEIINTPEPVQAENIPFTFLCKNGDKLSLSLNIMDTMILGTRIISGVARPPDSILEDRIADKVIDKLDHRDG